jgi:hypothetical protein
MGQQSENTSVDINKNGEVTYSLTPGRRNSEAYYQRIREFTDEVLARSSESLSTSVSEFTNYLRRFGLEEPRSDEEYFLELLSFGLLWKTYGRYAQAVRIAPFVALSSMAEWRKRHQRLKPFIDMSRGVLVTLFLLPKAGSRKVSSLPTLRDVDRLCMWLEATGEFREQALRFIRWRSYWETMPASRWQEGCAALIEFVEWFVVRSEEAIGEFTANVDGFLANAGKRYRWREDRVQCSRSRAEYHLNMVGAEIMNRAFRNEFKSAEATAVLVPGCMRGRAGEDCKAIKLKEGLRCAGCLQQCRVNRLREMGSKRGFETYIIPHASDLSLWSPRPHQRKRGVVAVSCVTTLVEGGWELRRYGVNAQCVLLDYSGCSKHWRREAIPTSMNVRELKRILEEPKSEPRRNVTRNLMASQ